MRGDRLLLFFTSLILFLGLSVLADRGAGVLLSRSGRTAGVIFPPHARHQFRTAEFSFNVGTNSLGFRDREFASDGRAGFRILAFGDSFTYGWGVEIGESWPKVLESSLRAAGHDAEVANLGKPGGSPKDYADIAEQITPILRPNLIVVAVLQGDDLAQVQQVLQSARADEAGRKRLGVTESARQRLRTAALWLYPNFSTLAGERVMPSQTLGAQWKNDAQSVLRSLPPESRARFEGLDDRVKDAFMNGMLNPSLVSLALTRPDHFALTLRLDSAEAQALISGMARQLERVKKVAAENNAAVLVVSVPYGVYVSQAGYESRRRLGFSVAPEMLSSDAADEAVAEACRQAGLPFHNVTAPFRRASADLDLFFELDGHFNAAGQRLFGESLTPAVERMMTAGPRPTP